MSDLNSELTLDIPPKTMYKYTSFKNAFNILTSNKIYFAKLSQFNDPFERLMTLDSYTPEGRRTLIENIEKYMIERWPDTDMVMTEEQKQEFVDNPSKVDMFNHAVIDTFFKKDSTGFCCLTDTYESLPMWAHYANNHTGCCLIFDFSKYPNQKTEEDRFPFHHMKKVEYRENLPTYNMGRQWHDYFYKSNEWQYEHEWRAIMFNKDVSLKSLNSFLRQKSHGADLYSLGDFLCGIILGNKMMDVHKKSIKITARQRRISVQQASHELYKYGIRLTDVDSK